MQSTRLASISDLRMFPSPDWLDDMEPLASTKPAAPAGDRWWTMCCTQAKLALPLGGTPYCQRLVLGEPLAAPVGDVEGCIGQDEVGLEVGMAVAVEAVAVGDLALDAADGQVHLGQSPGGVVGLLAVDGDVGPGLSAVAVAAGVSPDEFHRLHEHAGRTAEGVVDTPPIGLQASRPAS